MMATLKTRRLSRRIARLMDKEEKIKKKIVWLERLRDLYYKKESL